ncbi:MAG: type II CRISPR RNA-guided endonuclease Cas9 [Clostridia bacterium]|nr:type II CRISPR RNA-guided endonuclease Cas9 [Clostridia bacterium]
MGYRIGLDIGITSVGWAVVKDDDMGEPVKILDLGVRIFEAAEVPKSGASLAEERSKKRSNRRRLRRRTHRILRVKQLLIRSNIVSESELYQIHCHNIYEIRVKALDHKISKLELASLLIHFVKKRGYQSNAKYNTLDDKNGKVLKAIAENDKILIEKGYRTVGEMYLKDDKFKYRVENEFVLDSNGDKILKVRNKIGDYGSVVKREHILHEIKLILDSQRNYYENIDEEFINEYINIFLSQRNFDEGPAFTSHYTGNVIEKMIGTCTFEKNELRAAKSTYTFEIFKLLQDLNKIKIEKLNLDVGKNGIMNHKKSDTRELSEDEKVKIIEEFRHTSELSYFRIREIIHLPDDEIFNMIHYNFFSLSKSEDTKNVIEQNEKNTDIKLRELESFHKLRKVLDGYEKDYIYHFDENTLDYIATILTLYKSDEKRIEYLSKIGLNDQIVSLLLNITFSNFSHLSIKAMKKIIPYLKEGLTYDKATNMVYHDFRGNMNFEKKRKLSLNDLTEITNPVVRRGISQSIKVINAIIDKYGSPEIVNIELAREFITRIGRENAANALREQSIVTEIKEKFCKENVTDEEILKYRLWKEQNGTCIYSGDTIPLSELFSKKVDIDYMIPYHRTFDNSYHNKVLAKVCEIRSKGDMLPNEYILKSGKNIDEYKERVLSCLKTHKKVSNLLKETISLEEEMLWKERNLKDTQYITRIVLSLIRNYLYIEPNENISESKRIMALRGGITYTVRKMFHLNKSREDDKHHALDAVIIAIVSEKMIQSITCNKRMDLSEAYQKIILELKARMKDTDSEVKKELEMINVYDNPKAIFVSKMPNRKVRGMAHKETINGLCKNGNIIVRKKLTELKLNKENEIENYYNKKDDRLLYEALRKKLIEANGNAKVAFSKPFFKPKSNGEKGPIVNKVKLELKSSSNVKIDKIGGVAGNGDTVRIDVFHIPNEGYYFVPIYVSDTIREALPSKACVSAKPQSKWKEMKNDHFIFSLYPGDLVYIQSKKGFYLTSMKKGNTKEKIFVNEIYGYYIKCGINSSSIALSTHDRRYWQPSLGVRNLAVIKKYQVDILGNYTEVKLPEIRMNFHLKK